MNRRYIYFLRWFLNRPLWVLLVCLLFVMMHLSCDGTLARTWNMGIKQRQLDGRMLDLQKKNALVEERLDKLSDKNFLEKEVRSRFNLVGQRDIIFIFSNDKIKDGVAPAKSLLKDEED